MSKIFTPAELIAIEEVKKGNRKDPTGIFTSRVKPKIIELLEWFGKKRELEQLLRGKQNE